MIMTYLIQYLLFVLSVVIVLSTLNPYLITDRLYIYLPSHIRYFLDYLYVNNNYLFLSLFILSTVFMLNNIICCVCVCGGRSHINMPEGGSGPPHPQNETGVLGPQDDQGQEKYKTDKYNKEGDVRDSTSNKPSEIVSVQPEQSNRMVYPSGQDSPITRPSPAAVANSSANVQNGTHYTSSSTDFPMTRSNPLHIANPTVDIRNGNINANISANSPPLSQGSPPRH